MLHTLNRARHAPIDECYPDTDIHQKHARDSAAEMAKTGRSSAPMLADATALQALVKNNSPIASMLPE